ncbi:autotransporter outer membrane beta-barrel domain-containing protein [Trabulsiella odontotermitis]|uniref:autotransporter outer membrane beta-barrel domain-containing protein n=1 Tax=Trabulsiella odontotermitis TaxID=379893 RepID=UPI0024B6E997|nr:autotransporter outer membrane beta-barrel domain-containing protein [Trabulsiella odontotermitis]WHP30213.1 autotransporter outer membrane beta-barrel domain-containing protein [Trabulsiella odontotermitis]
MGSTNGGTGELIISNGGTVTGDYSTIGSVAGSTGTVTVDGAGAVMNTAGITVGNAGEGTLNITSGGEVNSSSAVVIGVGATGSGTVTVNGPNSVLNANGSPSASWGSLYVGSDYLYPNGTGTLTIADGGVVNSVRFGMIGYSTNSNGVVNVSSNGQLNLVNASGVAQGLTIGNSGTGTLNINTAGNVTAGSVGIGSQTTGVGTANIDGVDALLNTAAITVGASGQGTLTITDSGVVNSTGAGTLGSVAGSTGDVDVSTGGQWNLVNDSNVGQNLVVGGSGEGTLNIHADSSVTAGATHIGFYLPSFGPGGTGTVTVDGAGAVLNTTAMTVGSVGQGTLVITDNGVVNSSGASTVAANAGSTGTVDVSSSSNWNLVSTATGTAQNLTVGHQGNGTVNINTTGTVTAGNTVIGNGVTGVGTVKVDGIDAMLNTAGLTVGQTGTGTLNITDSGVVNSSGAGAVGAGANSNGEVIVSDGGIWDLINASGIRQILTVGNNGTGTLNVSTDGMVSAGATAIGGTTTGVGTVKVDGTNAVLNTTTLTVANLGQGTLTIADSGIVKSTGAGIVGTAANSTGTVIVDGTGSQWNLTGTLTTGGSGTGTMTLTDNARVTSQGGTIGNAGAGNGTVDVSTGAEWNNLNGTLTVGNGATGTLNIHDTGVVDAAFTLLGGQASGEGTVNVVGSGAVLNAGALTVGQAGTGTLTVTDGGVVKTAGVTLGNAAGSSGTIDVSSGASWDNGMQILTVGNNSTGTVNIHDGGTITTGAALLGKSAASDGTVNVDGAGSILNLVNGNTYIGQSGKGALNITNGGVVEQNTPYGIFIADGSSVSVDGAGSTLGYNAGALWVTGDLSVTNGGLVNNIPAGIGISITGTAEVDGADSRLTGSNFTVNSGGTLDITQGGSTTITAYGVNRINGTVNVDGAGSTLDVSPALLYVGATSPGTTGVVRVTNGGAVTAVQTILGTYADDTADVLVDGEGSTWTSISGLNVGSSGAAIVSLTHNAVMDGLTGASIGTAAGSNGTVNASSGGQLNLVNASGAAQGLTVGNSGAGTLNINTTGTVTAGGSTIGNAATGVGTVNVNGQDSVLNTTGLTVGYGGLGTLSISDSGTVNSTGVGVVGSIANSTGTVDVNSGGTWNLVNNGVAQNLTVAQSGTGTLNIHADSSVTAGNTQLASAAGSIATVTVDGTNAVLNAGQVRLGVLGNATMTLSNGGTLSVTNNVPVSIASNGGGTGTLNVGAAHGDSATGAGFITGTNSVNMGAGTGTLVFNHTETDPTTAGGYQFTPLITGNGTVMQDAGHTVISAENTYSGATQINGGTLTTTVQSTTGNTGLGTSAVNIAAPGMLEVAGATTDGSGNFTFSNLLTGNGLLSVDLASAADTFAFAPSAGTAFAGVADLKNSTFALSGDNATALTDAMLITSTGNTTTVSDGVQQTDGLAFNGGTLVLDISLPGAAQSDGVLQTGTLVAGAGTFSRNGRDFQASGTGNVQVTLTDPWNDPGLTADPDTSLNLLQQDDTRADIQLVQADTVIGSGGSLMLTDQNGNAIGTDETVAIAQNGTVVADGLYGIRMTTAPGDGLYVNYGLKEVDIRTGQTLTLAEFAGATGADADMSAKVSGSGNLAVSTGGTVSLSNGLNDYSGTTLVQAGTLRTDADGALGNTRELNISSGATADLNNTVQTAGMLTGQAGSTLNLNGGALTLANGGLSNGSLAGSGYLNVDGGVLTINGANSGLSATTAISNGAQVSINDIQGAGTGDITDDGTLTLDGVTGTLVNSLSGTGTVALSNETDISATADNALFTGTWDVQDASLLHFSREENAGTATVSTHNTGTLSLDGYHGDLNNSVTGAGIVMLTGNADVTATETGSQFTGTYDVQSGSTLHVTDATLPSAAALNDNGLTDLTTAGAYTLQNVLTGTGILKADTAGEAFDFASAAGSAFAGTVDLSNATLALGGVNTSALTNATLNANTGSITTVADGEQVIGGLTFAGGEMVFNATLPDEKVAASHVTTTTLEASGTGTVQITVPASYVPDHETSTTSSLMTQDEAGIEVQLVSATQVTGSGGNLELRDQGGNTITDATQVDITQGGSIVAKGTYDYRLTTTGTSGNQDGLYVNYGLKELELLQGQTLTLEGDPGATGAAADQSARITGSGNLAILTADGDVLSLSDGGNDYTGETTVLSGTLRTDADGALGNTSELNISSGATADLNGTLQTAGILNTEPDGTLALNAGTLNLTQGGNVKGEMTGDGQLNVNGGILTVESVNTDMTAGVMIADGATVVLSSPDTVLGGQGAHDVTVAEGGTLGGQGMVGGNVVNSGMLSAMNALPGYEAGPAGRLTLGGNLTNSGTLNLAGSKTGNQLVVNGNYTGSDGLLALNTVLDGDDSPTDKLTVHGDTTGNTRVSVTRAGGTGAQTVNGIELVQVDGSSAGNFALTTGTVEAGAYVYTLAKGTGEAAKNWYLTSKWNGAVPVQDPPVVDPTAPDALRPEAGSYISNIAAANTLFNHRLHDRLGEPQYTGNATSMWMRHVGGHERSSAGDGQLKTQSNRYVLQLGGDIAQWSADGADRWHLGVMGGYANEHSNTRSGRAGYDSDGRVSGYSAGLYGTWYQNDADKTGAYVDSWMLYNWFDSSVTAENRDSDEYKSKGLTASLEAGYTLKAGEFTGSQGTLNTWYVQPQAQVTWMGVKDDAHTRNDGTRIETEGDGNIQTRLGVRTYLNSHHKRDDGKQREFQPFVEVNWIHNTEAFGVKMDGTKVSRDGARNLGEIRTGVEGKLNDRLSVWGNVGVQMGDKGYSDTQGMLGVKYSW